MYQFPGKHRFAFTIFDDTDHSTLENTRPVYNILRQLGLRTTKSVWPLSCVPNAPCAGSSLQDREYLEFIRGLREDGFEIGLHNMRNEGSNRDVIRHGLEEFERLVGYLPRSHSNHSCNRDNLYWGPERISNGLARWTYDLSTRWRYEESFAGHLENSPYFWGDLCQQYITYVRNFVFDEINLAAIGAGVPYHDPKKPFVNYWFSASEGGNLRRFCNLRCELNQDKLEAEGGVCIVYTHFGYGFVEHGQLNARLEYLMRRLAKKNGCFVPTSTLLDGLRGSSPGREIVPSYLAKLERRWLLHKFRLGST